MDLKERLESNHVVVQRASTSRRTRTVFPGTVGPFQQSCTKYPLDQNKILGHVVERLCNAHA